MIGLSTVVVIVFAALALMTLAGAARFVAALREDVEIHEPLPPALVVLPLRGVDAGLTATLQQLSAQEYPRYQVRVIVDSAADPAYTVALDAFRSVPAERGCVDVLRDRQSSCSLKCSALVQATADLPVDVQVVVLVDSDGCTGPDWLAALATPLMRRGVGLAFGNRWYRPTQSWGSVARYLWNAYAVVAMYFVKSPWGGSMAIRRGAFEDAAVREKWSRAVVDDASIRNAIVQSGWNIAFAPKVIAVGDGSCRLAEVFDFVVRQLAWTRLYLNSWLIIFWGTILIVGCVLTALILIVAMTVRGHPGTAVSLGGSLAAYVGALVTALFWIDYAIVIPSAQVRWTARSLTRVLVAIPLTVAIHVAAVFAATWKRRFTWRGVTYLVKKPWDVRWKTEEPTPGQSL